MAQRTFEQVENDFFTTLITIRFIREKKIKNVDAFILDVYRDRKVSAPFADFEKSVKNTLKLI